MTLTMGFDQERLRMACWRLYSMFSSFLSLFSIWFQFWCFSLTLSDLFYRYAINNKLFSLFYNYFDQKRNIWGWL